MDLPNPTQKKLVLSSYRTFNFVFDFYFVYISAFHLSYNMLLNQIRSEDGHPENLLRNSFYQFQADRALPDLEVCRLIQLPALSLSL